MSVLIEKTLDLPEIVSRRDLVLFRDTVKPVKGILGDTAVPRMVQVTHPSNLDPYYPTLDRKKTSL